MNEKMTKPQRRNQKEQFKNGAALYFGDAVRYYFYCGFLSVVGKYLDI